MFFSAGHDSRATSSILLDQYCQLGLALAVPGFSNNGLPYYLPLENLFFFFTEGARDRMEGIPHVKQCAMTLPGIGFTAMLCLDVLLELALSLK